MPEISIGQCLIGDSAREEQRNKMSLLGFLGFATTLMDGVPLPADIQVQDIHFPLNDLTFVFCGKAAGQAGQTRLAYEIFDQRDTLIFTHSQEAEVAASDRSNFIFNVRLLKFPHAGRYQIRMKADGQTVYNGFFLISQVP